MSIWTTTLSKMSNHSKLFGAAMLLGITLTGCQSTDRDPSTPQSSSPAASPTNFADIYGQFPSPATTTSAGADEAPVGRCVKITGKSKDAALALTDCYAPDTTHRIIQRVATPNECVRDADRRYYRNTAAGEWTACLDIYWNINDCLSVTNEGTHRVACNDSAAPIRIRATKLVLGVANAQMCPVGYPHPVRQYTICTEAQGWQ